MTVSFFESRILKTFVVAGLLSLPVWGLPTTTVGTINGIGTLTLPSVGAGQTLAGGLLSQTTKLNSCNLTATVTTGPCFDTAFVSSTLGTTDSVFLQGLFNGTTPPQIYPVADGGAASALATAFGAAQPGTGGFAFAAGGALPVNITVTNFSTVAAAGSTVAGMTIQANATYIDPQDEEGPPAGNPDNSTPLGTTALPSIDQLVWTQITYDNYFLPSTVANPATLLDSYSNNGGTNPAVDGTDGLSSPCTALPALPADGSPASFVAGGPGRVNGNSRAYCDPIYPFQSNNGSATFFTDTPQGPWRVPASFRAIDFLSSISSVGGVTTLTVYDNAIVYGFDLKTPEPAFRFFLAVMALGLVVALYRRRTVND